MAIEHESPRERELWLDIADRWYTKASMRQPRLGRLLHHRAILARRHGVWKQLNLYSRALTTPEPFDVARGSIETTVFGPALAENFPEDILSKRDITAACTDSFVRLHAADLLQPASRGTQTAIGPFFKSLQSYVAAAGGSFSLIGETMAITNLAALHGWNKAPALLRKIFDPSYAPTSFKEAQVDAAHCKREIVKMWYVTFSTFTLIIRMLGTESVLAHVHIIMAFLYCLSTAPSGYGTLYIGDDVPWDEVAKFLNSIQRREHFDIARMKNETFIHRKPTERQILPEDASIRGMRWTMAKQPYLPDEFFENAPSPEEQMQVDRASNSTIRGERIMWLGMQIANVGVGVGREVEADLMRGKKWLRYADGEEMFMVN